MSSPYPYAVQECAWQNCKEDALQRMVDGRKVWLCGVHWRYAQWVYEEETHEKAPFWQRVGVI